MNRDFRTAALALPLLAALGCGGSNQPPPAAADPDAARAALSAALDAWRSGAQPSALADRSPPIRVADEDWLAGAALAEYRVSDPGQVVGTTLRCPVELTLRDAKGRRRRRRVVYEVGTDPAPMVVRVDGP